MPVCKTKKKFLNINRHMKDGRIFVVIEQEDDDTTTYMLINNSTKYSVVYQQVDNKNEVEVDICDPREK